MLAQACGGAGAHGERERVVRERVVRERVVRGRVEVQAHRVCERVGVGVQACRREACRRAGVWSQACGGVVRGLLRADVQRSLDGR